MMPDMLGVLAVPPSVPAAIGFSLIGAAIGLLTLVVNCLLAWAVFQDARKLSETPGRLFLLGEPVIWGLVTLVSGVLGFLAYWLIHHSTLCAARKDGA